MPPEKFASPSPQALIYDSSTAEKAHRVLEEAVMPAIEGEVDKAAAALSTRTGQWQQLIHPLIAHRPGGGARALGKFGASRARHAGASHADIARAIGRTPLRRAPHVHHRLVELIGDLRCVRRKPDMDGFTFTH